MSRCFRINSFPPTISLLPKNFCKIHQRTFSTTYPLNLFQLFCNFLYIKLVKNSIYAEKVSKFQSFKVSKFQSFKVFLLINFFLLGCSEEGGKPPKSIHTINPKLRLEDDKIETLRKLFPEFRDILQNGNFDSFGNAGGGYVGTKRFTRNGHEMQIDVGRNLQYIKVFNDLDNYPRGLKAKIDNSTPINETFNIYLPDTDKGTKRGPVSVKVDVDDRGWAVWHFWTQEGDRGSLNIKTVGYEKAEEYLFSMLGWGKN